MITTITRRLFGGSQRAVLASALTMTLMIAAALAQQDAAAQLRLEHNFDIPAQPLTDALIVFARQSGLQVSVDGALVRDLQAPAITGAMPTQEALIRLLAGSGLVARRTGERTLVINQAANDDAAPGDETGIALDKLLIEGELGGMVQETGAQRDARKQDEIFGLNISTDYLGREEVERFRGASTADVFQGLTNVYSGAARNGGAIDANIRGTQGAGRAPVIIDGTEQAIVINRGYRGASNRSYIDPSLIAGVQALKGPVSVREVNSQSGGAIVVQTLDANDILAPGENFGLEVRLEGGNNSTGPRLPTLRTGQDARNIKGFPLSPSYFNPVQDPTLRVKPRTKGDNDIFSLGDRAARIAAAGRKGDFDLFGAYAYRERGNYFSGRKNSSYYADKDAFDGSVFWMRQMAFAYRPGNEVTNSSSALESWLLKTSWRIAGDQALKLGYRRSRTAFGEIMPSRVATVEDVRKRVRPNQELGDIQWPLSRTHIQALNLEYKYAPRTPWLNVHTNVWATRARSNTYSSGGYPNVPRTEKDATLINTALNKSRNNRWGVTLSNKMELLPSLDLTVGGHYQYEKLRSDDDPLPSGHSSFSTAGREGNRQEHRANLQLEWRPTKFLIFNGGVSHTGYRAFDDGLHRRLKRGETVEQNVTTGWKASYRLQTTGKEPYIAYAVAIRNFPDTERGRASKARFIARLNRGLDRINRRTGKRYRDEPLQLRSVPGFSADWKADADGKFSRANMPKCLKDTPVTDFDLDAALRQIQTNATRPWERTAVNALSLPEVRRGISGARCFNRPITKDVTLKDPADLKSRRANGWEPYLTATLKLSEDIRVYGRYAERLRFPSVFESTSGFSASTNLAQPVKPERMRSWEAAYIHNFASLFDFEEDQHADFKLVYFHNTTKDVVDRDNQRGLTRFINLDRQVIAGIELQARFDTGRFFFELGATHILTHKVCDESTAALYDQTSGLYPKDCVNDGFIGGYLQTQAIPTETINLTLGRRFFDRRLELGARTTYYSKYDDRQAKKFSRDRSPPPIGGDPRRYTYGNISNPPLSFGETLLFDAYAKYKFSDQLTTELVGTNLTDQYYTDPLGRTFMPAPGRQIRLSITGRF